jgi:hypothetical protein
MAAMVAQGQLSANSNSACAQALLGVAAAAHALQQDLTFSFLKPDTAVRGLVSEAGGC